MAGCGAGRRPPLTALRRGGSPRAAARPDMHHRRRGYGTTASARPRPRQAGGRAGCGGTAPGDRQGRSGMTAGGAQRSGVVAVVGAPNAGKSTLVNHLVGAKVSIVTHKVQTTRTRIRGIAIHGDAQIVFVDTPGIFTAKRRLERAMVQAAGAGAEDAVEIGSAHG